MPLTSRFWAPIGIPSTMHVEWASGCNWVWFNSFSEQRCHVFSQKKQYLFEHLLQYRPLEHARAVKKNIYQLEEIIENAINTIKKFLSSYILLQNNGSFVDVSQLAFLCHRAPPQQLLFYRKYYHNFATGERMRQSPTLVPNSDEPGVEGSSGVKEAKALIRPTVFERWRIHG